MWKYTQIRAEDLQVGTEFIYGQSWHKVLKVIDIYNDQIMLRSQSIYDQGLRPELCILKQNDMRTVRTQEQIC